MNSEDLVKQLLENPDDLPQWVIDLPDNEIEAIVACLKSRADDHWYIDANHSLMIADKIVQIGQMRGNLRLEALGVMARGDASKMNQPLQVAWETLDEAGRMFQEAQYPVGWARTRIGRLGICVNLNRANEALADAELAEQIFEAAGEHEFVLRVFINRAVVFNQLGEHQQALDLYQSALARAEKLGTSGEKYLEMLFTNIGYTYNFLGDFHLALTYHERAREIDVQQGELVLAAIPELNMAYVLQDQGQYRRALQLLQHAGEALAGRNPFDHACARRVMVECYLSLKRYREARNLSKEVISDFANLGADFERARTLQCLAAAEAELGNYDAAATALETAESLFVSLGAIAWNGTTHLRRGSIALKQSDYDVAQCEALMAAATYASGSQMANSAAATLLQGQVQFALGNLEEAFGCGRAALHVAQQNELPGLRYGAHVLLGRIMESKQHRSRACREYQAAAATVDRVQQGLTITLRPGFLEDKTEALHALIRLRLQDGDPASALAALEKAKSQVLLGYLVNRDSLHWSMQDAHSQTLIQELEQLRAEHHWYYRIAYEPPDQDEQSKVQPEQAHKELAMREKRMRAITEQLYLESTEGTQRRPVIPSIAEIQAGLPEESLLVEFYNDGTRLWGFALDSGDITVYSLPITTAALHDLIDQFQYNVDCALAAGASLAGRSLTQIARRLGQQLYQALLGPLQTQLAKRQRLIIVPYGALHYLPFHLLHTGDHYLIEQSEVVIWPAAGMVTHHSPVRSGGALTLAHTDHGRLPSALVESRHVHELFGGVIYCEEDASRVTLAGEPRQILHIAAHGEHRIDHPDLSFIELADGQLYTDDLLQRDLSYELVTLSACETGQAHVSGGDELIGLGRGFLYSGAGALITSLWRLEDSGTVNILSDFYAALQRGNSKAAALRSAQRLALDSDPDQHPAFWGAFQLIGDPEPLHRS